MSPKDDRIRELEIDLKDVETMLAASKDQCDRLELAQLKVLEAHPPKFVTGRDGLREVRCEVCQTPEHHTWGNDNFQPWPCPTVAATGLRWACYHEAAEVLAMAADIRAAQAEKVMGPVDASPPEAAKSPNSFAPYGSESEVDDDLPMVCVNHLRFLPCRTMGPCHESSHPDAVHAVRTYQEGRFDQ